MCENKKFVLIALIYSSPNFGILRIDMNEIHYITLLEINSLL